MGEWKIPAPGLGSFFPHWMFWERMGSWDLPVVSFPRHAQLRFKPACLVLVGAIGRALLFKILLWSEAMSRGLAPFFSPQSVLGGGVWLLGSSGGLLSQKCKVLRLSLPGGFFWKSPRKMLKVKRERATRTTTATTTQQQLQQSFDPLLPVGNLKSSRTFKIGVIKSERNRPWNFSSSQVLELEMGFCFGGVRVRRGKMLLFVCLIWDSAKQINYLFI